MSAEKLYRCYDADDVLIYVGVTRQTVPMRLRGHRHKRPEIAERTVRWEADEHETREAALDAEAALIYERRPELNDRLNPARHASAGHRLPEPTHDDLAAAVALLPSARRT